MIQKQVVASYIALILVFINIEGTKFGSRAPMWWDFHTSKRICKSLPFPTARLDNGHTFDSEFWVVTLVIQLQYEWSSG